MAQSRKPKMKVGYVYTQLKNWVSNEARGIVGWDTYGVPAGQRVVPERLRGNAHLAEVMRVYEETGDTKVGMVEVTYDERQVDNDGKLTEEIPSKRAILINRYDIAPLLS